jgi:hypothetical protein
MKFLKCKDSNGVNPQDFERNSLYALWNEEELAADCITEELSIIGPRGTNVSSVSASGKADHYFQPLPGSQ